mmetsp:Transcript_28416/g.39089  ORF Transcript_28416/g.39089 Transcript_28416/m.39089 type:complete len:564 (+) Transcript_28416:33-1724(+)
MFGIGDRESEDKQLDSLRSTPSSIKRNSTSIVDAETNAKLDKLISLVEEMHIKNRENNAILFQMIFTLEEKLNKRIDNVRKELLDKIISKSSHPNMSEAHHNGNVTKIKTLASIFDSIEPDGQHSKIMYSEHISNDPYKDMTAITVVPTPGFVIKTRRLLGNKEKAFINVFHHPQIEIEPPGVVEAGHAPVDKPFIICGVVLTTSDKQGMQSFMYNIAVSSEYFSQPKPSTATQSSTSTATTSDTKTEVEIFKITSPQSIQKIIQKINARFDEFLDESTYSLPRLANGFKGDSVHPITVPVHKKKIGSFADPPKSVSTPVTTQRTSITFKEAAKDDGKPSSEETVVPERTLGPKIPSFRSDGSSSAVTHNIIHQNPPSGSGREKRKSSVDNDDSRSSVGDNESVMSSMSSLAIHNRRSSHSGRLSSKAHRKSLFDQSNYGYNGGTILGRNLLSAGMLDYVKNETIDSKQAQIIKKESITNPNVLLGWQIKVDDGSDSALFVVTDVRKNFVQKTEFRLSRFNQDDTWALLKRADNKSGFEFRAMRKVLNGLTDEEEDDENASVG